MEHIKPPPEMDFGSSDGTSIAEAWRKWRQAMEIFLALAMTGKDEAEQCSLYIIGPVGRDIYHTFNISAQEKNKIVSYSRSSKGILDPNRMSLSSGYRFNTRTQQHGESIDQYGSFHTK